MISSGSGIAGLQQRVGHLLLPWVSSLLVGGSGRGCLPGSCLLLASTTLSPPLLLFSPSPVPPYSLLPISLLWARFNRVGDPAFAFTQGAWWCWQGGCANQHRAITSRWRCNTHWGGTSGVLGGGFGW